MVKNLPAMQETQVQSLGGEDSLGEGNGNCPAAHMVHWTQGRLGATREAGRRLRVLWGLQTSLFPLGSSSSRAAAVSLQRLLIYRTDKSGPWPVGT